MCFYRNLENKVVSANLVKERWQQCYLHGFAAMQEMSSFNLRKASKKLHKDYL